MEEWPGAEWLKVLESSSPRFEPLPYCVTLSHILTSRSLGFTMAKQAQNRLGTGRRCLELPGGSRPREAVKERN